jgi:hypothetical protein
MAGLASLLVLCLTGISAPAPVLRLEVAFAGQRLRPRVESIVVGEAAAIWSRHGVEVHVVDSDDPVADHAVRLSVVLSDRPASAFAEQALGSIKFVGDAPGRTIEMYAGAVASLITEAVESGKTDDRPLVYQQLTTGRVLGRALAHEIGHFLLQMRGHSASGLMRARHSIVDLASADRHGFVLSAADAALLEARRRDAAAAAGDDRSAAPPSF